MKLAYGLAAASGEFTLGAEKVEKTIVMDAGTIAAEALQTPAGPPASDAFFVLYKQKTSAAREELGRSSEKPALFHLNAGDYALAAFAGPAMFDTTVKVVAGKVSAVQIALNVGTLEIKTFAKENSPELVAAWHQISPAASDQKKGSAPLARFRASSQRLQLPAGSYRLETIYGNVREEKAVSVTAGQTTPVTVILNAGEAKVSLPSGGTGKVCAVYEAGADRKAEPVGRAAGADMRFILKAGRYELECRGKGEDAPAKQTEITIVAGETRRQNSRIKRFCRWSGKASPHFYRRRFLKFSPAADFLISCRPGGRSCARQAWQSLFAPSWRRALFSPGRSGMAPASPRPPRK